MSAAVRGGFVWRVGLGLGGLLLILLIVLALGGLGGWRMQAAAERVADVDARKLRHGQQALFTLNALSRQVYPVLGGSPSQEDIDTLNKVFTASQREMQTQLDSLAALGPSPEEQTMLAAIRQRHGEFNQATRGLLDLLAKDEYDAATSHFYALGVPALREDMMAIERFLRHQDQQFQQGAQASAAAAQHTQWSMAAASGVGVLAFIAVGMMILRSVSRPLGGDPAQAGAAVASMADGQLHQPLPVRQGDGRSLMARLEAMRRQLGGTMGEIASNTRAVEDAAQALSAECLRIAEGAQAQTLSTASIASAVEELDGAIHTLSSHTEHVVTQAHSAETLADQAQSQLDSAAARMGAMRDTLSQAHGDVGELADKTESIGQVVAVIQGIAEQTNLLALNAAIEAARAGETGRGFAVVADEVRKLAEHTARATQNIAGTISAIQQQTRQAAERLNHSQAGVDASVEEIAELHPAMEQLRAGAGKTRQAVEQLQSGLAEQASAAGLIGQQAERVAQTAEAFVHGVRRSTDTADSLLGVVGRLNGQLAQFRV